MAMLHACITSHYQTGIFVVTLATSLCPVCPFQSPLPWPLAPKDAGFFTQKWQGSSHSFKNTVFLTVSPQITCSPVNYPLYFLQAHETAPELQSGRHREGNFTSFLWVICILHVQKYSMNFIICLIYTFIHKKQSYLTYVHLSEHNILLLFKKNPYSDDL